jgi:hypothetical protein
MAKKISLIDSTKRTKPGNPWRRLSTVELLINEACFVTKVNEIYKIKRADIN